VHAAFHPSAFEASLARHQEGAAQAAAQLAADIQDGRYEPSAPTFNQGLLDGDEGDGEAAKERAAAPEGPVCLWKPARAAQDYRVAKKLVATVDHQRGLKLSDNPLLPQDVIASAGAYGAQEGEGKDTDMGEQQRMWQLCWGAALLTTGRPAAEGMNSAHSMIRCMQVCQWDITPRSRVSCFVCLVTCPATLSCCHAVKASC
jgi:hypothetical protein